MNRNDSSQAMLSLASAYGDDADETINEGVNDISGSEDEDVSMKEELKTLKRPAEIVKVEEAPKPPKMERKATRLVSYGPDDADETLDDDEDDDDRLSEKSDIDTKVLVLGVDYQSSLNADTASSLSRSVQNMAADDIMLPPEPAGRCSQKLQEKITNFVAKMRATSLDLNDSIQNRKDFRNPSIYEKLINFIGIDEKGTNYPPEIYNPSIWGPESYYDELAKTQKTEMDKREKEREKERKERTKIEFMVGTKKSSGEGELKRKTKWDAQPSVSAPKPIVITTTAINPPVVSVTTSSSGTKTTVISAIGTIKKPR